MDEESTKRIEAEIIRFPVFQLQIKKFLKRPFLQNEYCGA